MYFYLEKFNPASYDDIYFIEINTLNDLDKIHQINRYPETLIYIIGGRNLLTRYKRCFRSFWLYEASEEYIDLVFLVIW